MQQDLSPPHTHSWKANGVLSVLFPAFMTQTSSHCCPSSWKRWASGLPTTVDVCLRVTKARTRIRNGAAVGWGQGSPGTWPRARVASSFCPSDPSLCVSIRGRGPPLLSDLWSPGEPLKLAGPGGRHISFVCYSSAAQLTEPVCCQ